MSASRLLLVAAAVCFLLAALVAGAGVNLGPPLAWIAGGFCAWTLSGAVVP